MVSEKTDNRPDVVQERDKMVETVEKAEKKHEKPETELQWAEKVDKAITNGMVRINDTVQFMNEFMEGDDKKVRSEKLSEYAKAKHDTFAEKVKAINAFLETQLKGKKEEAESVVTAIITDITETSKKEPDEYKNILADTVGRTLEGPVTLEKAKSIAAKKKAFDRSDLDDATQNKLDLIIALGEGKFDEFVQKNNGYVREMLGIPADIPENNEAKVTITMKKFQELLGVEKDKILEEIKAGLTLENLFTEKELLRVGGVTVGEKTVTPAQYSSGQRLGAEEVPAQGLYTAEGTKIQFEEGMEISFVKEPKNEKTATLTPTKEELSAKLNEQVRNLETRFRVKLAPMPVEDSPEMEDFNEKYVEYQFTSLQNTPLPYGVVMNRTDPSKFALTRVSGNGETAKQIAASAIMGKYESMLYSPLFREVTKAIAQPPEEGEEIQSPFEQIAVLEKTEEGRMAIITAALEDPTAFLEKVIPMNLRAFKIGREVFDRVVEETDPELFFTSPKTIAEFSEHLWGRQAIVKAAETLYNQDKPLTILNHMEEIVKSGYKGQEIVKATVNNNQGLVLDYADLIAKYNSTMGEIIILAVAKKLLAEDPTKLTKERREMVAKVLGDTGRELFGIKTTSEKVPVPEAPAKKAPTEAEIPAKTDEPATEAKTQPQPEPAEPNLSPVKIDDTTEMPEEIRDQNTALTEQLKKLGYEWGKVVVEIKGDDLKVCTITIDGKKFTSLRGHDTTVSKFDKTAATELFKSALSQVTKPQQEKSKEDEEKEYVKYVSERIVLPGRLHTPKNKELFAKKMLELEVDKNTKVIVQAEKLGGGHRVSISFNGEQYSESYTTNLQTSFTGALQGLDFHPLFKKAQTETAPTKKVAKKQPKPKPEPEPEPVEESETIEIAEEPQTEYIADGELTPKGEKILGAINLEDKSIRNRALRRTRAVELRIKFGLPTRLDRRITPEDLKKALKS